MATPVLFASAGQLLGDLCPLDSDFTQQRRLRWPLLCPRDDIFELLYLILPLQ